MTDDRTARVAVITGAGRGIGREHALELARQGVAVVVNDLGGSPDGTGADATPAKQVVAEIEAMGGQAVADDHDISEWDGAEALIDTAISHFGSLDILVNNAGILRDRTIAAMTIEEWDAVIKVHLRGTFAPSHFAAAYWRARAKATGKPVGGRLINTTSPSGIYGNFGQANYAAAKAGIAAFTIVSAKELASSGVTANAVAPAAVTRLTQSLMGDGRPDLGPERIAKLVGWLASPASQGVTGRVFDVIGSRIGVAEGWHLGPRIDKDGPWTLEELDEAIPSLVAQAAPPVEMNGEPRPVEVPRVSLNVELAGTSWEAGTRTWSSKDALIYALGVGAGAADPLQELQFTTENSAGVPQVVLPTFAVTLGGAAMPKLGDFGMEQVLHAEQSVEVFGPLPVAGTAVTTGRIVGFWDKGRDALIEVETDLADGTSGRLLARLVTNIFVRGEGGFGGDPGPRSTWVRPDREPDAVLTAPTRTDQALLYRLSGDRNPLHSDPAFAARAGFDRPILHGLCSYGITGRMLLADLFGNDVHRFGRLSARFTSVVRPGDELVIQAWTDADGADFVVTVGKTVVLGNGRITERRGAPDA